MIETLGLYEIAIKVRDLNLSEQFYRNIFALQDGLLDTQRNWLFLRIGSSQGMIVLQETPEDFPPLHFAFRVSEREMERAAHLLKEFGIATKGPVKHDWIPAKSLYFSDPDSHDLELCAPLQ
ncbi:MAG: VOC family protein [Planctomycetaceae bacterium]